MERNKRGALRFTLVSGTQLAAVLISMAFIVFFYLKFRVPKDLWHYLASFTGFAVLILVYTGAGIKAAKFLKMEKNGMFYPFAFSLGIIIFGILMLLLGAVRLYNPVAAFVILALAAFAFFPEIKEMKEDIESELRKFRFEPVHIFSAVYIAVMLACSLLPTLYYDSLKYHLGVAGRFIAEGGIVKMPESVYSNFPLLMQTNYVLMLLFSFETSVKLFNLAAGLLGVYAVSSMAGFVSGRGRHAGLLLLTLPLFFLAATRAGAETWLMLFSLLMIYGIIMLSYGKNEYSFVSGLTAGAALSVKYTGAPVVLFGFLCVLFLVLLKKTGLKQLFIFCIGALFVSLPFLMKNIIFTGDPFYPLFAGFFGVKSTLLSDAFAYVSHVKGFGSSGVFGPFFEIIMNPENYGGDMASPLMLIAIIVSIISFVPGFPSFILVTFIAASYFSWAATGKVLRFLLPAFAASAALISSGFERKAVRYFVIYPLIAVQALISFYFAARYLAPMDIFIKSRKQYLSENLSYYKAADFLNKQKGSGRVLFMGEARSFWCEKAVIAPTVFASDRRFPVKPEDNIRWILVNRTETERLKDAGYRDVYKLIYSEDFRKYMDKYFEKIYSDENCDIYEIKSEV